MIKDLDADIIALQEVENKELLKLLIKKLPQYKYYSFSKYKNSSIGLGFISKIKILSSKNVDVKFSKKIYRPILESTFILDKYKFKIFNNHWASKRVAESYRIKFAKKLYDRLLKLPKDFDYILLGDFNSNYNEFETFYNNKKLNNTSGITGINQVLNTTFNKEFVYDYNIFNKKHLLHYNLWLEKNYKNRFSSTYRGSFITPDNIILPSSLFDNIKISYVKDSFKVFKPTYLFNKNKINRWEMKNKKHLGRGFSDHLPIIAFFTTSKINKKIPVKQINQISQLYDISSLNQPIELLNAIVIYKNEDMAIIKQENNRAIFIYKNVKNLKLGYSYNLKIKKIKDYQGLKEINEYEILSKNKKINDFQKYYLEAKDINLFDLKYQNEIIKNLKGTFRKHYLYFNNNKIKIYFKNKKLIPKQNSKIIIKRAHLGYYKNKIQIVIYKKSEINVN